MQVIIRATEALYGEWVKDGIAEGTEVVLIAEPGAFTNYPSAGAYIDLLFEEAPHNQLHETAVPVLVSYVAGTLKELPAHFTRINGWPTMMSKNIEAATTASQMEQVAGILSHFHKTAVWVPDEPGFITPRVISSVINEAYIALNEKVSTREDINTAMKLGTNYPYGPFEWAEVIGTRRVRGLLLKLADQKPKYTPADILR